MQFELRRKTEFFIEGKPLFCFGEKYFSEIFGYSKVGFWRHYWKVKAKKKYNKITENFNFSWLSMGGVAEKKQSCKLHALQGCHSHHTLRVVPLEWYPLQPTQRSCEALAAKGLDSQKMGNKAGPKMPLREKATSMGSLAAEVGAKLE